MLVGLLFHGPGQVQADKRQLRTRGRRPTASRDQRPSSQGVPPGPGRAPRRRREFAVLLENLHERGEMTRLAEKALSAIQRPYECGGPSLRWRPRSGLRWRRDNTDADRLIQLADAAMYAAKRDAGQPALRRCRADRWGSRPVRTGERAAQGRPATQLELHFQPVVAMVDGHTHSYESLLRWPHAQQEYCARPHSWMRWPTPACAVRSTTGYWTSCGRRPSDDAVLSINLSARLLHDEVICPASFRPHRRRAA